MASVNEIKNNIDKTLNRRRQMASVLESAFRDAPEEMEELLKAVGSLYTSGKTLRMWDVLAALAGADRGYGNDWYFTALEIQKQIKEEQK